MRIGILIKEFKQLSNWELRIIEEIIDNPKLELSLLIQDGTIDHEIKNKLVSGLFSKSFSDFGFGSLILGLQKLIEKRIFPKVRPSVDSEILIGKLNKVKAIKIRPLGKDQTDVFNREDLKEIRHHELDVILKLGFNTVTGAILDAAKYGIWDFLHMDHSLHHRGPTGFWEVLTKKPVIGFTLLKLTSGINQGIILDRAFFNRHWSYVETGRMVEEASVSVLFKNIRKFMSGERHKAQSSIHNIPTFESPGFFQVMRYIFDFYIRFLKKLIDRIFAILFGIRQECWTLFLGKGSFMESQPLAIEPVTLPKNEFWADPFLFTYKEIDYVFFENYSYKTKRGKISCGIIRDNEVMDVVDVLDLDYHLSFPFIFEEDGEIYLMPETSENKRLELYQCVDFPSKWELYSTAFEGERVADAFFYNDRNNQKWLFLNKQAATYAPINSELFIYKVDSLKMKTLQPHAKNPVIIDSRIARNGGAIFEHDNVIYRPSQKNTDGIYGNGLNINRIEKLTIDEYIENKVMIVEPDFDKNLLALHHLHQQEGQFAFDAAYKSKKG